LVMSTLSLHDALPISLDLAADVVLGQVDVPRCVGVEAEHAAAVARRDEPHPVLPDVGRALAVQHPLRQLCSIHRSDLAPRCHPSAVPGQPITAHVSPSRQPAKAPTGSEPHGTPSTRLPNATPNCAPAGSVDPPVVPSSTPTPSCSHKQRGSTANSAERAAPGGNSRAHSTSS